jgi:hypothetical protein
MLNKARQRRIAAHARFFEDPEQRKQLQKQSKSVVIPYDKSAHWNRFCFDQPFEARGFDKWAVRAGKA